MWVICAGTSSGTTISGVGAGAVIDLMHTALIIRTNQSIMNMTITNGYTGSNSVVMLVETNPLIKGCTITGCTANYGALGTYSTNNARVENSVITHTNGFVAVYAPQGKTLTLSGCTVNGHISPHDGSTIILEGTNRFTGVCGIWDTLRGYCVVKANAILDMRAVTNTAALRNLVSITVENGAKYIPYGGSTAVAFTAGTYTKIYRDGTCE